MTGTIAASSKLQVGYFAQHQIEELVPDETPFQHMERLLPGAKPGDVRAQLGRFGFSGDKANLAVRQLSGGERARLSLALITRDAPHTSSSTSRPTISMSMRAMRWSRP
jgi:ATP-binding cassette subfamily F protein 3